MRVHTLGFVLSAATLTLMFQSDPVLASKPAHAQEQSQSHGKSGKKVDPRDGRPRQSDADRRAGFTAGNVRDRDRDDDRREAGWQNDPRYRGWDNDRDHDRDHDWDDDHRRHDDGDHDSDDDWRRDERRSYTYYDRYDRYYYPRRGYVVYRLPPQYRVVRYSGVPYYFSDGSWYRPYGSAFSVVSPPIGLTLSFLPNVYTTLWFGGNPYYRANDIYYRWMPQYRAYMVTPFPGPF